MRLPDPGEVVYIRAVVSQVLTREGGASTVLARPLNDKGQVDAYRMFYADVGVSPDVIVFPKEKQKWRPPAPDDSPS